LNQGFKALTHARFITNAGLFRMTAPLRSGASDTRKRLLEAAESLFIDSGYEAMSLRQVTAKADANLAAVNYHFGSKEALMQELLAQRLDQLNRERLQLLGACEAQWPNGLDAAAVLGILFIPAFRISHDGNGGKLFMRLLGRVYSDHSPFISNYLQAHYKPIFGRFFDAFSRALPSLPRSELGLRLHFALKALSGILAGEDMQQLITDLSMGDDINDGELLARLISLISPMLTAPFGSTTQIQAIDQLLQLDQITATAHRESSAPSVNELRGTPGVLGWLKEGKSGL